MSIRLIDIRGFEDQRGYANELPLLLEGKLPEEYEFPDQPSDSQIAPKNPNLKNEIHLVCFVTGTSNPDLITETLASRFKEIEVHINKKGLPTVVIATKYDELCPKILEDAKSLYVSPKALSATKKIAKFFGIEEKHVYPVVNYVNEEKVTPVKDKLALQALDAMVKLSKDYLENHKYKEKKPDHWSKRGGLLTLPKQKNEEKESEKGTMLKELAVEMENIREEQPLRVLCIGPMHSGKTSFIDSIASLLTDEICSKASGGYTRDEQSQNDHLESTTNKFQMYQMKFKHESGEVRKSNVFIGDLPGFQPDKGIQDKDVKYVVQGNVPNKYKIKDGIKKDSKKFIKKVQKKNRIHCVCYVFDISNTANWLHENFIEAFRSLQTWLLEKDIPYVVVLTKGDQLGDAVKENALSVYENKAIKENKDKLVSHFRFKESKIYPVVNYVHEQTVVPEFDILLSAVFKEILKLGKDFIDEMEDCESGDEMSSDE